MEYLFSYGTLQKVDVQMQLFGRKPDGTPDVMKGYSVRPMDLGSEVHKLAVKDENSEIHGTRLELTAEEIAICDKYEPEEYQRINAVLVSGNAAWVYAAAEGIYDRT